LRTLPSQPERDTKAQVIEAAERLFGRYGLEGVSLRQIAAEAGSSNPSVVQYHFGDKRGLIQAIYVYRLAALEVRRGALLAQARQDREMADPRTLLEVLLGPLSKERDQDGRRSYAAFLLSQRGRGIVGLQSFVFALAPLAEHIVDLLRAAVGPMPERLFRFRLTTASVLYWQALVALDAERGAGDGLLVAEEGVLAEVLNAGAILLTAPVSADVAAAFGAAD